MTERTGRISASSQESAASTSPSKPSASDASPRSSGTPTSPESLSATGPMFPDGETSLTSPLLGTPNAHPRTHTPRDVDHGQQLANQVDALLPTPDAGAWNDGQTTEAWRERHERELTKGYNGNGGGTPIAALIPMLASTSSSEDSPASPPAPPADAKARQTTAGSGPSSPVSLASWDRELSSWRTSQVSLLSTEDERFPRSWERWPTSGMTRRGQAFALPTWGLRTGANGSSSLPSPAARDSKGRDLPRDGGPSLPERMAGLLPTPVSHDRPEGRDAPGRHGGSSLTNLLASPTAWLGRREAHSKGDPKRWTNPERSNDLSDQVAFLGEPTNPPSEGGKA